MANCLKLSLLTLTIFCATNVLAQDDQSFVNYESIVNELKADAEDFPMPAEAELGWDEVALHGGLSIASSFIFITAPNGASGGGMLKGFEAHAGANLFSREARAELAFRSFTPEDFGKVHVDLKEIEARLIFLPVLRNKLLLRMGFGLTMRFMDIDGRRDGQSSHSEASTPSSSLIVGLERKSRAP
ncbi:MAG: hypothetical protein HC883_06290 [Bdellovibrionaceae bacterium]|nr:hypothetical protein [Pseudobdellovibrionaceae bacterium]